jgi:hypothetical protein
MRTTENKLTELAWEQVSFFADQIITASKLQKNYNDDLMVLLKKFIKNFDLADFTLMELYSAEMHVLYNIIKEAEELEKYELCAKIKQIIQIERELYLEWIMAMTDEEIKEESIEEYNYTNIFFEKYKNK